MKRQFTIVKVDAITREPLEQMIVGHVSVSGMQTIIKTLNAEAAQFEEPHKYTIRCKLLD